MNNKHIELVKKWLADKDSVSHVELVANSYEAYTAYTAASAAAYGAAADATYAASYWVKRYEELTK